MRHSGKALLYDTCDFVTNWPGTLKLRVTGRKMGSHNIAVWRYDMWFQFEGFLWHGVRYGNNTQLVHCKRTRMRLNAT